MRIKSRSRRAKAIVALTVLFALSATAAALAAEVQAGKIIISIEGGITPAKLSKTKPTPITLKISGSVKTSDGSPTSPP